MKTNDKIIFGPFFVTARSARPLPPRLSPLNLALEWSSEHEARRIYLSCHSPRHGGHMLRLENIVFRQEDLPFGLECQRYQVIGTSQGSFLPVSALLAKLYLTKQISRPIFQVLKELAAVIPLQCSVSRPIVAKNLLVPEAEIKGFFLNSVFRDHGQIYAQIVWQGHDTAARFHVCVMAFNITLKNKLALGSWMPNNEIGVSQILSNELRQIAINAPRALLTDAGRQLLEENASHLSRRLKQIPKTAPDTNANENSVKFGVSRPM